MEQYVDTPSSITFVEAFYSDYIARSEELQGAIQRSEWTDINRYVAWREEKLSELESLPRDTGALESVHKEYLSKIMVLELENINSLNGMMQTLKASIRESQEQIQLMRYSEQA